jgi:hypothetical protein
VCVGEFDGNPQRLVFGYVVRISGNRITRHIADDVFSPEITGLEDGEEIEVDLEDIFASEFSQLQIELEARGLQNEIEGQWISQHWGEFNTFCPPEYRQARRAFVQHLIRTGDVQ